MTFEWSAPCYIRRAGWFTYAKRIRCEYKTVQRRYIQEEPGIKATAQEKSHFSRKSTHFQFKHDFGTTSARLRHDFGTTSALARCTLIWVGDSPPFDFPLVSSSTKKKVHRNRPSAVFPPHTSYNHKCYSFTRKKRGDGKFSPPLTATFLSVSRLSLSTWSNLESYEQTTS